MKGPDTRGARGSLALAAARRRRATLNFLREVAVAEGARNRAHAVVAKAQTIVDLGTGAGLDMTAEAIQLGGLRQALASAESNLSAARQLAGLGDAT